MTEWPLGYQLLHLFSSVIRGCPKYLRAMHATSLETLTLIGLNAP